MTRKDYVALAAAFKRAHALVDVMYDHPYRDTGHMAILTAAEEVAETLAEANPRFDKDRFIASSEGVK